jgi:phosphoglycerol transferase MdoB-like AlkP superfamily enzyme
MPHDSRLWYLAIDLPFAAAILLWYPQASAACRRTIGRSFLIVNYLLVLLIVVATAASDVFRASEEMDDQYTAQQAVVKRYGLLVFNLVDLTHYRSLKSLIAGFETGDTLTFAGDTTRRRNVLFIQVESLDARAVNAAYRGVRVMPFLHSLESRSIYYPYCMSYHKAGSTSDCEFSVINSIEALDEFPAMKLRDYSYPNSLARRFSDAGYAAVAFHGNRGDYFNRSAAFKGMRFNRFNDMFRLGLTEVGWGAPDSALFGRVIDTLRQQRGLFVYYVITMTSHEPWTLARQYFDDPRYDSIPDLLSRNYFVSLEYVDRTLKWFVDSVRAIRPNTVIMIYGDHSPGIKNGFFRQSALVYQSRYFEFVPLFICIPGAGHYREQNQAVSFLDIEPTAIDAAGITGRMVTRGASLLSPPHADQLIPFKGAGFRRDELFKLFAAFRP